MPSTSLTCTQIANQTLSQSVPPSVITTINGYTKVFIGQLIERARDVQTEWMASATHLPSGEAIPATASVSERTLERDRGPLLPDHLREALRRYKKECVGGGVGFQGLSMHGKEHTAVRNRGRRFFS